MRKVPMGKISDSNRYLSELLHLDALKRAAKDQMPKTIKGLLIAASMSAIFAGSTFGQAVNVEGSTAGPTAKALSGVTNNGENPTAGKATPTAQPNQHGNSRVFHSHAAAFIPKPARNAAGNMAPLNGDESGVALSANTKNAGPAARSAEATAHKTVYDPNDQLGTSLEGKTLPNTAQK
jgi:hypothetical protein